MLDLGAAILYCIQASLAEAFVLQIECKLVFARMTKIVGGVRQLRVTKSLLEKTSLQSLQDDWRKSGVAKFETLCGILLDGRRRELHWSSFVKVREGSRNLVPGE